MRLFIFKIVLFIIIVAFAVAGTIFLFRTDYPFLWVGSVFVWFVIFLFFPYGKFFKVKK